ncbi:MAG: DEAD/DEAH box helicase [Verrucomicrobiales bacterium]|nr:DEAD/DEAH box helicase [Verrucomicrobiales bacterium]
MQEFGAQLDRFSALDQVIVPDLWQQDAVQHLRAGRDVVVHAATGAGKTFIFELWSNEGRNPGQAIYTVPTRALANDKLAEWRARGWNVGIATGDLSENLDAPVIVATLETQKNRLITGDGPRLLVIDEYQMLGDADRGLNYELAIAMAPPQTQLLMLSGSVANPRHVVAWLQRLGRQAEWVWHDDRPVPLEEVYAGMLNYNVPSEIRGYWPRFAAKALAEGLGPILVFAPRRRAAKALAVDIARNLPNPNPLQLTAGQKDLVDDHLARMLQARVAYHHSGLSYGARAGVVEPLAKAGQLRVVVATMGLAAGINFSLRSVTLAADSYRRDHLEVPIRADEIHQMFGRAGRRGIDEIGYGLVSRNEIRIRDGHPCFLSRNGMVDWASLLGLMHGAAQQGREPYTEAVRVQERLFSTDPILLGMEFAMKHPEVPCGLGTDSERARKARKRVREMLNSQGGWEAWPKAKPMPLSEVFVPKKPSGDREADVQPPLGQALLLRPALMEPEVLRRTGAGELVLLPSGQAYGREQKVADQLNNERLDLAKWVRRLTGWRMRVVPLTLWQKKIQPLLEEKLAANQTPVERFRREDNRLLVQLRLGHQAVPAHIDLKGVALWRPQERQVVNPTCSGCGLYSECRELKPATGVALLWKRLRLVQENGSPTRRGRVVSFFSQSYGLGIAAALEDESLPIDELVYELANLDAGYRFGNEENRWEGRIPIACRERYGDVTVPGYLDAGLPPRYGSGAEQVIAAMHANPADKANWVTDLLGAGDIDRAVIEWRSLLRQITHAPELDWTRWTELRKHAGTLLAETESPTLCELPPLEHHQQGRVDHRLRLKSY